MDLDTPEEPAASDQMRLRQLRQKFFATYAFNLELQAEKAANERILSQLRNLVASTSPSYDGQPTPFSLISSANNTKDAAAFATYQLGQIRDHLAEVKPKYAALLAEKEKAASEGGKINGPDAERKQYIEKMTRRHQELTRKLRLNARGDVVGGNFDSGELKKGSEEVQKLEEIAGKLSKGQR
jgi:kinetochore protein Mis12/MTW1